jgi:hypothetical protein
MTTAEIKKIVPQLTAYIDAAVENALEERFGDPDAGLELRESFVRKILAREKTPKEKYISHQELKKRLGLT